MEEKLKKLDTKKLIDVVKNYRQYGYDESLRTCAISVLEDRGITKEQLEFSGNLVNKTYDYATELYNTFRRNSTIALVLYGIVILSIIFAPIFSVNSDALGFFANIIGLCSLVTYFIFLLKSYLNQSRFYREIGQDDGTSGIVLYVMFTLGAIVYLFMYFYFRNQMKEKMKEIR